MDGINNDTSITVLGLLTPRQRRVLELVAEGKTNKQIARELFLSEKTVKNHRYRICRKLGLNGYNALYRVALNCFKEV